MAAIGSLSDVLEGMKYQGDIKIKNSTSEPVQSYITMKSLISVRLMNFKIENLAAMEKKIISIDQRLYLKNVEIEEKKDSLSIAFKNDVKKKRLVFTIIKNV